ncbi:MAG: phosphoesterase PA-phosphatase [Bacteroidota bacterium]|nr:phosphoesterase PA-phosphatase [Bacteroidota bacterium]
MNKFYHKLIFFLLASLIFLNGCKKESFNNNNPANPGMADATKYDAQIAIEWMNEFRNIVQTNPPNGTSPAGINPPRGGRIYAYAGIALYESIVDGVANNKSLQGQLNGFALGSIPENKDSLDYGIVVNEALCMIAKCDSIVPFLTQQNADSANAIHDRFLLSRSGIVPDSIIAKSRARGIVVATAVMKYASTDNFLTVKALPLYVVPARDMSHLWYWEPTDLQHTHPAEPYWGQIRPFVLTTANEVEIPQSVIFSEDTASAFGRQAREVYNTVNGRTQDQSDIRLWWSDATGTQTPAGHWVGIIQYIIHQKNLKLGKAAELYALVGITMADAFVSCWDAKYKYNLLRPETYIRAYINAGWTTSQGDITPPFPEYPSGHSVCSGSAAKVLTSALGTVAFTDSINTNLGSLYPARSYPSFDSAANEAGLSRLYGGIHYRDAIVSGLTQGRNLGQKVIDRIKFR